MADTTTSNYGWTKPEVGASDSTWGTKQNAVFDAIDAKIKSLDLQTAGAKAAAVDADVIGLMDSAAGFIAKKYTWGNLKAQFAPIALSGSGADISTGTIADARLPSTMAGKTFSSNVAITAPVLTINADTDRSVQLRTAAGLAQAVFGSSASAGSAYLNLYDAAGAFTQQLIMPRTGSMTWGGNTVWTAGNDGNGSGLDADVLRGAAPATTGTGSSVAQRGADGSLKANNFVSDGAANSGTLYLGSNFSHYLTFDGTNYILGGAGSSLIVAATVNVNGGVYSASTSAGGNPSYYCNVAGVSRGLTYYDGAAFSMNWNLYNASGTFVRNANYRESDGRFYVAGFIESSSAFVSGNGHYVGRDGSNNMIITTAYGTGINGQIILRPDGEVSGTGQLAVGNGNITWSGQPLIRADGNTWTIGISGNAATATTASNSNALGGVAAVNYTQYSQSTVRDNTSFPMGQILNGINANVNRRSLVNLFLETNGMDYSVVNSGGLTQLAGSWASLGRSITSGAAYQRVA